LTVVASAAVEWFVVEPAWLHVDAITQLTTLKLSDVESIGAFLALILSHHTLMSHFSRLS